MLNLLVEGDLDEFVLKRILRDYSIEVLNVYGKQGKQYILKNLGKYVAAAKRSPWIALLDLDNEYPCAPDALNAWVDFPLNQMTVRISINAIESWLLADHVALSEFFSVSVAKVPTSPDNIQNPKQALINLARKSRIRTIREGIVPREGAMRQVGTQYNALLLEFVTQNWEPLRAAEHSDSLARCIRAVAVLATK